MTTRFLRQLERLVGAPEAHRYLLAVSGGADSSVMAALFHACQLPFAMAHCNFHLRGEDSNRDMRLVQSMADQWQVPLYLQEFDTLSLQKDSGLSIEMLARQLRYDWFEQIGKDFDFIVTAHQADDAAETMLLNLCRGTGLKGMVSIPEKNGKIIRPLLCFSAKEIRDYAQQQQISFAIDCTNADETIKRNRIRNSVLPVLAELNPNLIETFSHNREIFQMQYHFYQKSMEQVQSQVLRTNGDVTTISISMLQALPEAKVILYEILKKYHFNAAIVDEIGKKCPTGTQFHSPTHSLIVNRDEYLICPRKTQSEPAICIHNLNELQQYFTIEKVEGDLPVVFAKDNNILYLPMDKMVFPMMIRHWQDGDYFYPLGGKGKQKLSDFFNNQKIDRYTKKKVRLLCFGTDIVWIIGYRSSEKYKLDKTATNYYKIQFNG
ncbi:MAG: tRNA lysidine(34) synthetase TilS [Bacteroidales bacterium]|nr:tRNA lysidine(34) synthetase TilS [Bacteroidales bacterium]